MEKGFIIFHNYIDYFKYLNGDEVKELIIALCEYSQTKQKPNKLSVRVDCYFEVIKQQIDINAKQYQETCEKRAEAGRKRWQKENNSNNNQDSKSKQKEANATKCIQKQPNDSLINININKNINNNINNKKENNIKEKSLVAKANTPQAEVFEYFAKLYKQETNIDYLGKGIDYINLAKLIKKYGKALVIQKIKWLLVGCKHSVFFFSKDMTDFNISTLTAQWDRILPKLTDEQKKEQDKLAKEAEKKKWVMEQLKKQGIVIDENSGKGGLSVIS